MESWNLNLVNFRKLIVFSSDRWQAQNLNLWLANRRRVSRSRAHQYASSGRNVWLWRRRPRPLEISWFGNALFHKQVPDMYLLAYNIICVTHCGWMIFISKLVSCGTLWEKAKCFLWNWKFTYTQLVFEIFSTILNYTLIADTDSSGVTHPV